MRNAVPIGLVALLAMAGCATGSAPAGAESDPSGLVEPTLVVERFLQAANAIAQSAERDDQGVDYLTNELHTMARLFGTRRGSVLDLRPRAEVEQRMFALASLLGHRDYSLEGQRIVPGRTDEAIQIIVRLATARRTVDIPFTMVRSGERGWLVEQIDVERLTSRG